MTRQQLQEELFARALAVRVAAVPARLVVGALDVDAALAAAQLRIELNIASRLGKALALTRHPAGNNRSAGQFSRGIKRKFHIGG